MGGQLNGRSMAGSSVGTFYCKPWDSSMVSGCGWRIGWGTAEREVNGWEQCGDVLL